MCYINTYITIILFKSNFMPYRRHFNDNVFRLKEEADFPLTTQKKWLKTFIFISDSRKPRRQCRITVMLLLGPGASLPQTQNSVVSLQSVGGITVLRLCGLALLQKKGRHCEQLYARKKTGSVERRQAALCLLLCFPSNTDHVQTRGS